MKAREREERLYNQGGIGDAPLDWPCEQSGDHLGLYSGSTWAQACRNWDQLYFWKDARRATTGRSWSNDPPEESHRPA